MRWLDTMQENIKKGLRNWLNVQPAPQYSVQINEIMDFELSAIRNRIWYRGDSNGIEQWYQQSAEYADKYKFWASKCTPGMEMRKIHTGLPGLMVRILSGIVIEDMNDFEFENDVHAQAWKEIEKENKFRKMLEKSLKEVLYIGDGAYKVMIDTSRSDYPLIEWYSGERIEIIYDRGRLKEVIFKKAYTENRQQYVLHERYGYGYITNKLYKGEEEVDFNSISETKNLSDWKFDKSVILAVPLKVYENTKFDNRGGSIFDGKLDSFDAFDEVWSQWMDALRAGRAKTYVPEAYIPKDPKTGMIMKPNAFDNRFIAGDNDMSENGKNAIITEQPNIPHDSYLASYCTALDLCLQGIISPSTLGIDVKKLDNAEAQREKEKATLYTRNAIVEALQEGLKEFVTICINAYNILLQKPIEEVIVNIEWGEYANPSFESQIEAITKAKQGGIMSIEKAVDTIYGDTLDEKCKQEEIMRLKAEQGIAEITEPGVNNEELSIMEEPENDESFIEEEMQSDSNNRKKDMGNGEKGVSKVSQGGSKA